MHSSVHSDTIYNNKDTDTVWGSIDRWINKDTHTHTHTHTHTNTHEYSSDIKKNEILPFSTTWIDQESIMLIAISYTDKNKYSISSFIYRIRKQISRQSKTITDSLI